jgi:hypothetical protein
MATKVHEKAQKGQLRRGRVLTAENSKGAEKTVKVRRGGIQHKQTKDTKMSRRNNQPQAIPPGVGGFLLISEIQGLDGF